MQCNQPFYGSTLPNCGQFYPSIPLQYPPYPEVIGEGEVTSVVTPDGNIQCYFIPTPKPWPLYPYNENITHWKTPWRQPQVWFIRKFSNPISPTFNPQCPRIQGVPFPNICANSEYCIANPGFQLKFHNDGWTSTTDLHYFFPRLRQCNWFPKGSAAVQVDTAETVCHYEVICNQCKCAPNAQSCNPTPNKCVSCMSIDAKPKRPCKLESTSKESLSSNKVSKDHSCECRPRKTKKQKKCKQNKVSHKSSRDKVKAKKSKDSIVCECDIPSKDKSVTTYNDQASGCIAKSGCKTQTSCCNPKPMCTVSSLSNKNVKPELWLPKTSFSRKAISSASSENIIGVYETGCRCDSDTDGYETSK